MELGDGRTVEIARPEEFKFEPIRLDYDTGEVTQTLMSVIQNWRIRVCLQVVCFGLKVINSFSANFTDGGVGTL
jgi:hypothetical protein